MRALIMFLVTAVVLFPLTANATIINIPGNYPTIQEGIDHGADGDTVLVQPGTYYENLNFNGHNVVLGSLFLVTGDPAYISSTLIDGDSAGSVIIFESGEDSTAQVIGFTIQNGYAEYGGGIYCLNYSSPTISNNTISDNSASYRGGGVCCRNYCSAIISSNTINGNSAHQGGAVCCDASGCTISRNIIIGNSTDNVGGGIYCSNNPSPSINNNTVSENSAWDWGGGIYCAFCDATITNTILWGDTAYNGPEIHLQSSNATVRYCDVEGGWPGEGNIDADPMFRNPEGGDFRLLWGSPCIDAGDPNSPPDPDGTRADMGAFYHPGLLFWPEGFTFNLLIGTSTDKVFSIHQTLGDTVLFSLSSDAEWIAFLPDSGEILPESFVEVAITFDGGGLPLGPNYATIMVDIHAPYQYQYGIPVSVHIFSTEYTYICLTPDSLPITIPPEGGSFSYWAHTYNATDFTYRFDIWIDARLPTGQTYGPIYKKRSFAFKPQQSMGYHLTQDVPWYAPAGGYSYNCKMGVLPDQVDFQDSFSFIKFDTGSVAAVPWVTGWDLVGWGEQFVAYLGQAQEQTASMPRDYSLSQNYPNPFNATTVIEYALPVESHVKLQVYNVRGQKVATLVDSKQQAGYRSVKWDASGVSSGLYFYRLTAGDYTQTKRMMLVK